MVATNNFRYLHYTILFLILFIYLVIACNSAVENEAVQFDKSNQLAVIKKTTNEYAVYKTVNTLAEITGNPIKFPTVTDPVSGKWLFNDKTDWMSGFFPGTLWLIYEATNEPRWRDHALEWTWALEEMKHYRKDHDIGFRIISSFGNGYRLTQNEEMKTVLIKAAESLASRYDPDIGCIKSWDNRRNFPVIIDNMMNLELLFWTSELSGNASYRKMAHSHALRTLQSHIRNDGSTYHVVDFNDDGRIIWKGTAQGYNDESTWARGQAWAMYGFTMAYRYTEDRRFLNAAIKVTEYFIQNSPASVVPYYDFEDPNIPEVPRDASAAAIAASSLLELSHYVEASRYQRHAEVILHRLNHKPYISEKEKEQSILRKSNIKKGEPEQGSIVGDYYLLDANLRYEHLVSNQMND